MLPKSYIIISCCYQCIIYNHNIHALPLHKQILSKKINNHQYLKCTSSEGVLILTINIITKTHIIEYMEIKQLVLLVAALTLCSFSMSAIRKIGRAAYYGPPYVGKTYMDFANYEINLFFNYSLKIVQLGKKSSHTHYTHKKFWEVY